jgi:hypothetical protein
MLTDLGCNRQSSVTSDVSDDSMVMEGADAMEE